MDQALSTVTTLTASIPRSPRRAGDGRQSPRGVVVCSSRRGFGGGGGGGGGDVVNENMIVLRKRIRQVKIKEKIQDPAPTEWTEWEKKYMEEGYYNSDVIHGVALLQTFLLNKRPGFVFGFLVLLLLSMSTSFILISSLCIQLGKMVFFR